MDEAVDRQVLAGRLEVLADGQDLDAGGADVAQGRAHLVGGLAEPEHDAGLDPAGVLPASRRREASASSARRPVVAAAGPRLAVEPRHGLDVVREDLRRAPRARRRARRRRRGSRASAPRPRQPGSRPWTACDHRRPVAGAAVRQVVAVDRGDHRVAQAHARRTASATCSGSSASTPGAGPAGGHRAEAAAPGADLAQDHERRGAVLAPALVDVGAAGLLADRVELEAVDQLADLRGTAAGVASRMRSHSGRGCRRPAQRSA